MAEQMLALVRYGSREIVGGCGIGYEFVADLAPDLLDEVFDDDTPAAPGFYVWEGSGTFCGEPTGSEIRYEGSWRPAGPLDLAMMGVDESWN